METEGHGEPESDFEYVESTSSSEFLTSDEAEDVETLEAVFGAIISSASPSKCGLPPVECESLLLFGKDLAEQEEDVESSESGKFSLCCVAFSCTLLV